MDKNDGVFLGVAALGLALLYFKSHPIQTDFTDPNYRKGYAETPDMRDSTDDTGGSLIDNEEIS